MANNEYNTGSEITVKSPKGRAINLVVDGYDIAPRDDELIAKITGYNRVAGILFFRAHDGRSGQAQLDSASTRALTDMCDAAGQAAYEAQHGWRIDYDALVAERNRAEAANYHDPSRIIKAEKAIGDYLSANPEVAARLRAEAKPRDRAMRGED